MLFKISLPYVYYLRSLTQFCSVKKYHSQKWGVSWEGDTFGKVMLFNAGIKHTEHIWKICFIYFLCFERFSVPSTVSLSEWGHGFNIPPNCPQITTTILTYYLYLICSFSLSYFIPYHSVNLFLFPAIPCTKDAFPFVAWEHWNVLTGILGNVRGDRFCQLV